MEFGAVILLMLAGLICLKLLQLQERREATRPQRAPVPWISDDVWTALTRSARPKADRARSTGGNPRETIRTPQLVEVTDFDRQRLPATGPATVDPLQGTSRQVLRHQLLSTHGPFQLRSPVWPICCSTLATLICSQGKGISLSALEETTGPLDQAFLENELRSWGGPNACHDATFRRGWGGILKEIRAGRHSGTGINLFRCNRCHRHYVASCSP